MYQEENDGKIFTGEWKIITPPPSPSCVTPVSSMSITESTVFCSGTYNLNPGITINADNITVTCNSTILNGSGVSTAFVIAADNNVTIQNCNIMNYEEHYHHQTAMRYARAWDRFVSGVADYEIMLARVRASKRGALPVEVQENIAKLSN